MSWLNSTSLHDVPFAVPLASDYRPFYDIQRTPLISGCSDVVFSLIVPVVCYWGYSAVFHLLDELKLPFIEQYRIHEPAEITKRNKVTIGEVVKAVVVQHIVQTALGLLVLEEERPLTTANQHNVQLAWWASKLAHYTLLLLGPKLGRRILMGYGAKATLAIYWWVVPIAQLVWAGLMLDTWQYFMHRAFHVNKWAYRHIHARHHRLYVPYACGALYNHPLEGFLMDSLGAHVAAHVLCRLSPRQDMIFFGLSQLKTVDDHSGLAIPWNPFQFLFGNNADYHDIHHQQFGIKKNFSQPYFIHWDTILGTRMTRDQAPKRKTHTDLRDPNVQEGIGSKDVLVNKKTD